MKLALQSILANETQGTGQLADSLQVHRGTQRGKPIIRILGARHAKPFFEGTTTNYNGLPPSPESAGRFFFWAKRHNFNPKRLAVVIAKGRSTGNVYRDRSNILIRAMRAGFRNLRT